MRRSSIHLGLCPGFLAGCSQHASSSPLPAQAPSRDSIYGALRRKSNGRILASRCFTVSRPSRMASAPLGSLHLSNDTLYGNTLNGGKNGFGSVYKVSASGKESVLHSFASPPSDGRFPMAVLAVKSGEFYGTTGNGGTNDYGTIFKVSASGAEHVLYRFKNAPDGSGPETNRPWMVEIR